MHSTLMIKDLPIAEELDSKAMSVVRGGSAIAIHKTSLAAAALAARRSASSSGRSSPQPMRVRISS
jgi:hypothetical protein